MVTFFFIPPRPGRSSRRVVAQYIDIRTPRVSELAARGNPQIGAVPPKADATLLWVNDLFEDEIQFNQNPSQQGIFLKQRVNVVAVFVTQK